MADESARTITGAERMNDQRHRVAGCPHRELAVGWALHALEPPKSYRSPHTCRRPDSHQHSHRPRNSAPRWACPSRRRSPAPSYSSGYSVSPVTAGQRRSCHRHHQREHDASRCHRGCAPAELVVGHGHGPGSRHSDARRPATDDAGSSSSESVRSHVQALRPHSDALST